MSEISAQVLNFLEIADSLEHAGLIWQPEIGDEVTERSKRDKVSVLIDPCGMGPHELRETYLWLPTVEQMLYQLEIRQAILFHAGIEMEECCLNYKTVIQSKSSSFENSAPSLRLAMGLTLRDLLMSENGSDVH